jgi:hypothetical protein
MKVVLHDYLHIHNEKKKRHCVNVFKRYMQKCHANVKVNQEKCPTVNVRVKKLGM